MNINYIINYAKKLNSAKTIKECTDIAAEAVVYCSEETINSVGGISEYYDTVITVYVMAINRALSYGKEIDSSSSDYYQLVDHNSSKTEKAFHSLINSTNKNVPFDDFDIFNKYLEKILYYIFQSYNDHFYPWDTDNINEKISWDQWNREDDLRDYMMNLIRPNKFTTLNEFTEKYNIQIPYLYAFINEYKNIIHHSYYIFYSEAEERNPHNDGSYEKTMVIWLKKYIRKIRNAELFNIMNVTEYSSLLIAPDNDKENEYEYSAVSFHNLLPHIEYNDEMEHDHYYIYPHKSIISPRWYSSLPLVPTILSEKFDSKKFVSFLLLAFQNDIKIKEINQRLNDQNTILKKTSCDLENKIKENKSMINDFSHAAANMDEYGNLYDLAESLKSIDASELNINDIRQKLLSEYSQRVGLSINIEMLKFKFSDPDRLCSDLSESSCSDSSEPGLAGLGDLLNHSARNFLVSLFFSNNKRIKRLRDSVTGNFDWNTLQNVFDNEIAFSEESDAFEWMIQNMIRINRSEISPSWNRLHVYKEDYAYFYLINIFSEVIKNIFLHGDLKKEINFSFTETDTMLVFTFKNHICEKSVGRVSGEGLNSMCSTIDIINRSYPDVKSICIDSDSDTFLCRINLNKEIFVKEQ